jgi:hypothetical protein
VEWVHPKRIQRLDRFPGCVVGGRGKHFDSQVRYVRYVAGYNATIGTLTSALDGVVNRTEALT